MVYCEWHNMFLQLMNNTFYVFNFKHCDGQIQLKHKCKKKIPYLYKRFGKELTKNKIL